MPAQTNLMRRNGTYYCRVYIPKELQKEAGKKEVWRSLGTSNYLQASMIARLKTSEILMELSGKACDKALKDSLAYHSNASNNAPSFATIVQPTLPYQTHQNQPQTPTLSLSELCDDYNNAIENRQKSENTQSRNLSFQKVLLGLLGRDSNVFEYDVDTARNLLEELLSLPSNFSKQYPATPLKQVISIVRKKKHSVTPLSPTTVNNYLVHFNALRKFAYKEHKLPYQNITEGIRAKHTTKARNRRNPLSQDALKVLFSQKGLLQHKQHIKHAYKFWIPLLALCTGARLSEATLLRNDEIKEVNGHWFMVIQHREDRSIKTAASAREVPIHNFLIQCGLLDYLKEQRKRYGETGYLFQSAVKNRKDPADAFSKYFSRKLKNLGIKQSHKESFHSLRHSFRDATREAEIGREAAKALGGWEDGDTDENYGGGFSKRKLCELMNRLDFGYLGETLNK